MGSKLLPLLNGLQSTLIIQSGAVRKPIDHDIKGIYRGTGRRAGPTHIEHHAFGRGGKQSIEHRGGTVGRQLRSYSVGREVGRRQAD